MLMTREQETVQASGLGAGGAFTIAASAKAFEVLSSNLYQNKTLAVIREITCNAADAHRAAGLPLDKIEVHLPTFSEMWFSVRDYGSGLSTDDVLSLYTTYFRSTKDRDNSQIGGFGLGSKSPFAVADQFTVTSWHGGTKTTFVCFKADGTPQVNVVGSAPCGSETGLEVRVATTGAPTNWCGEAARLFAWWPSRPRCNVRLEDVITGRDPANIALSSDTMVDGLPAWSVYNSQEKTVVMGGVPYRLDLSAIPSFPEPLTRVIGTLGFHLALPIGTVNISPSREALSYDPATCKALIGALASFAKQLVAGIEALLDKQPTLAAARELLYGPGSKGLSSLYAKMVQSNATVRWRGQPVHRQVTLDLTAFSAPGKMTTYEKRSYWTNFRTGAVFDNTAIHTYFQASELVLAWTAKVTSKTYRTFKHNYGVGPAGRSRNNDIYIHLYHGMPYAELVARCEQLGIPKPINADTDLEAAPLNAKAAGTGRVSTAYYTLTSTGYAFERKLETGTLDLTGGGIYVPMWEGNIHIDHRDMARHCAGLMHNGWMTRQRVIGIAKTKLGDNSKLVKALAAHGWKVLDRSVIQGGVLVPLIQQVVGPESWCYFRRDMGTARRTIVIDGIRRGDTGSMWPGFAPIHTLLQPHFKLIHGSVVNSGASPYRPYTLRDVKEIVTPQQAAEIAKVCPPIDEFEKLWQAFVARHPLLKYIEQGVPIDGAVLTEYFNR